MFCCRRIGPAMRAPSPRRPGKPTTSLYVRDGVQVKLKHPENYDNSKTVHDIMVDGALHSARVREKRVDGKNALIGSNLPIPSMRIVF